MKNKISVRRPFVAAVLLAGFVVLAHASRGIGMGVGYRPSPSELVLWMAMFAIASMSPIPVPRRGMSVSLNPALDLAAMVVFGPALACWLGVFARIVSGAAERWNPLDEMLLKLGRTPVAVGTAGMVYAGLGGAFGLDLYLAWNQLPALIAAIFAYVAVTAALSGVLVVRDEFETGAAAWLRTVISNGLRGVAVLPVGVLLALTQVRLGPVGVALFLLPLLLVRHAIKLWLDLKRDHMETVRTLMMAVDAVDPYTRGHSYRISKMCAQVARQLRLPAKEIEEIEYAALLHDIGRTALRREILLKPGKLDATEQAELRAHPRIAYEMLRNLKPFSEAAEIVYAHHEQPDGHGYPRGLTGLRIPMGSRIIMTISAFDALTSDRPYRRGLAPEKAFDELLTHSGTQFFPEVVEVLIDLYASGALFDSFKEDELGRFMTGQGNSRVVEEYLRRAGPPVAMPSKVQTSPPGPGGRPEEVPELAFLDLPESDESHGGVYRVAGDDQLRLVVAGLTDVGCERGNNEDAFGVFAREDGSCLLVTADGMGGAAAGEVASRMAVDTLRTSFAEDQVDGEPQDILTRSLERANEEICRAAGAEHRLGGMGTTCTAALVTQGAVQVGHVGDSRAYLIADGRIRQLTRDHTLGEELKNVVGLEQAQAGEAHHVLTRCLGNEAEVEVDVLEEPLPLEANHILVLCTDGLSNMLAEDEILDIAENEAPDEACRRLVELARSRGGPDNITVQVARVVEI